jgi:hypothetical protein
MTLPFLWLACFIGVVITTAASWFYKGKLGHSATAAGVSLTVLLQVALWTSLVEGLFFPISGWGPARHDAAIYTWALIALSTALCLALVFAQKTANRLVAWVERRDALAPFVAVFAVLVVSLAPLSFDIHQAVANKGVIDSATAGIAKAATYIASAGEVPTAHQVTAGVSRYNYNSENSWTATTKVASRTATRASYTVSVGGDSLERCLTFSTTGWTSASGTCN